MSKLINIANTDAAVKDKVVYFTIDNDNKRNLLIWLVGGFKVCNQYESEKLCMNAYNEMYKIMSED